MRQVNARELRHLDIEKQYVVLLFLHHVERLNSILCRLQRVDIAPAAQRLLQCAAPEGLVIHDQHSHVFLLLLIRTTSGCGDRASFVERNRWDSEGRQRKGRGKIAASSTASAIDQE